MEFGETLPSRQAEVHLRDYFQRLLARFGAQRWWPARTRMEVILGAILTQNTTWRNASMAIQELRKSGLLQTKNLRRANELEIERCIRRAGFFRQKTATIRTFVRWLDENYLGSLHRLFAAPSAKVRRELLTLKGLGPETVDAILLYAGRKPYFVADAYTRRVLARHGWLPPEAGYAEAQEVLHRELPRDAGLFNEFHALLVEVGKRYCRRTPDCSDCPLQEYLPISPDQAGTAAAPVPLRSSRGRLSPANSAAMGTSLLQQRDASLWQRV